jgi:putative transposase
MWNTATRGRMVAIEKKTKRYPSDLTDEEWGALDGLLPQPATRGRKRTTDLREVVNALCYMVRSCPLSAVANRVLVVSPLCPPAAVQDDHDVVLMIDREWAGRDVDSRTIKAPMAEKRGYDAGKKIVGRKRHIAVDTDGRLLAVNLTRQTFPIAPEPSRSSMRSASVGLG